MLVSPSFLASILLRVVYLLTERPGPVTPVPRFARAKVPDWMDAPDASVILIVCPADAVSV